MLSHIAVFAKAMCTIAGLFLCYCQQSTLKVICLDLFPYYTIITYL